VAGFERSSIPGATVARSPQNSRNDKESYGTIRAIDAATANGNESFKMNDITAARGSRPACACKAAFGAAPCSDPLSDLRFER
jgi:hypothetical protein